MLLLLVLLLELFKPMELAIEQQICQYSGDQTGKGASRAAGNSQSGGEAESNQDRKE